MIERPQTPPPVTAPELKWAVGLGSAIVAIAWALPAAATWLQSGDSLPLGPALQGTWELVSNHRWDDPAASYPRRWANRMPDATGWWASTAWVLLTLAIAALGVWRRIDNLRASNTLGSPRTGLRGARPRSWARKTDLKDLYVTKAEPSRFSLGRLNGQRLASDAEAHVALIAPTRSGKTTRYVIPWLLEHDGPAIVTSTKTDVLHATRRWRERRGSVSVWDPFGAESVCWTPLTGCEDWQTALMQAQWLADAAQDGDSELATYWRGEAARLLAPLLHAAAASRATVSRLLFWVDSQDISEPKKVLERCGSHAALRQLLGICELDTRNRGTVYMSAGSLLAAYRLPSVEATAQHGLTAKAFLNGKANTLYLIASSRQQRLLAPLLVAILSGLLHEAAERANRDAPLRPTLRILLDETANIAPLRDLPAHLSQAAGYGVRIATVWQSLAQARQRYDSATDDILANSTAKLFLGPITDETTRDYVTGLLGDEQIDTSSITTDLHHRSQTASRARRAKATASDLQQLRLDRALLVEGRQLPALIDVSPWWDQRALRRRGTNRVRA